MFWLHFGILGIFRILGDAFITWGLFGHFGVILGLFWSSLGLLDSFGSYFGGILVLLGLFWSLSVILTLLDCFSHFGVILII